MFNLIAAVSVMLFVPLWTDNVSPPLGDVPRIVSQKPLTKEQCKERENDPLGCNGVNVVIENDNYKQVAVTLNCGDTLEEAAVEVPGRTRLHVEIMLDFPGTCKIKSWK